MFKTILRWLLNAVDAQVTLEKDIVTIRLFFSGTMVYEITFDLIKENINHAETR